MPQQLRDRYVERFMVDDGGIGEAEPLIKRFDEQRNGLQRGEFIQPIEKPATGESLEIEALRQPDIEG